MIIGGQKITKISENLHFVPKRTICNTVAKVSMVSEEIRPLKRNEIFYTRRRQKID